MAGLDGLAGEGYGPVSVELDVDRVAEFVAVTGDDGDRWTSAVPPLFASAALFAVAPRFLADPRVVPHTRSLIHSEQRFEWARAARVGETIDVAGRVTSVRSRGSLDFVAFTVEAGSGDGPWLSASAQFLLSTEAAGAEAEEAEPPASDRPETDEGGGPILSLPQPGGAIAPLRCGASRLDLIRYAAATRDWNPIHWDHTTAVSAGLSGTIVHGLLMAAWIGRAAARYAPGTMPLASLAVRFRKPLRPSVPATVTGSVVGEDAAGADLDLAVEAGGERMATARARVTA
jgi:acyl dehydratase